MSRSPYELSTPPEVLARLHPRLRTYFGAVPPGHVGSGEGVFSVVGTPRRWLWPLLAVFARDAVLFPVWERDVPFTVENLPARVRRGSGTGLEARPAVRAHRTFHFRSGSRTMVDAITAEHDGLVDHLGRRGRVSARLRAQVDADGPDAGALRLVSTRVTFRALGRDLRLPAALSPRVTLTERFDDEADLQRVSLVLTAPVLGTLYRYEGAFRYAVVPDAGPEGGR
ncbi:MULTISPECIES: DUF4166 domain-containing protein [unclassified Curtobacterium]|uniref:DUF4166 domain-containing protein n=1 Tax=unclassified Curtobacterium TaxID=257496 RepID=UPI000D86DFA5|nr:MULTISPECIES: DUF4166 domain-containing protein [unclassified Curtobacterium]PYY65676.1 DUF4166 domain-containing protein [Curtobacterium sp. MCPF17_003]PZE73057.1 DUF4166 domain-containing protein [Curtobacterium sp. MCPF17_018]PZF32902.1 DUF4166 domain-containing protein [Curtobacterium sp. MCPF17_051]WIB71144.1 DUF4166 domain-containing protein [Curtobacterium sp. MCBD17_026]